jgi:hypothetical protein
LYVCTSKYTSFVTITSQQSFADETEDVISYWTERLEKTPYLARFALSFCSAPATSSDSERSFSEGRHQINWNQMSMSFQAFRAQMSVGSWSKAPFFSIDDVIEAIESESASLRYHYIEYCTLYQPITP